MNNIAVQVYNSCCGELLSALSIYTTKILKPNISQGTNTLSQLDFDSKNVKYVIKWNYDLLGGTITIPKNCILEFDGGSISNGTIIGQDTLVINVGNVDIWGEDLEREGTWREKQEGFIQSDWNQENSNSPDYIKNKPTIIDETVLANYITQQVYNTLVARVQALEQGQPTPSPIDERNPYMISLIRPTEEMIRNSNISNTKPTEVKMLELPTIDKPTKFYLTYPLTLEEVTNDLLISPQILDSNGWEIGTWYDETPVIVVDGTMYRIFDIELGKDDYTINFN